MEVDSMEKEKNSVLKGMGINDKESARNSQKEVKRDEAIEDNEQELKENENGPQNKWKVNEGELPANFNSQEALPMSENKEKPSSMARHNSEDDFDCADLSYILDNPDNFLEKRESSTNLANIPENAKPQKDEGKKSVNNKHTILKKLHSMWDDDEDSSIRTATEQGTRKTSESEDNDDFLMPKGLENIKVKQRETKKKKKLNEDSDRDERQAQREQSEKSLSCSQESGKSMDLGQDKEKCIGFGESGPGDSGSFGFATFTTAGQKKSLDINEDKMQKAMSMFEENDNEKQFEPSKKKNKGQEPSKTASFGFASAGNKNSLGMNEETLNKYSRMFEADEGSQDEFDKTMSKIKKAPKPFKPPFNKDESPKKKNAGANEESLNKNKKKFEDDEGSQDEFDKAISKIKKAPKPFKPPFKKDVDKKTNECQREKGKIIEESEERKGENESQAENRKTIDEKEEKKKSGFGSGSFGFSLGSSGKKIGVNPKTMERIKKLFSEDEDGDLGLGNDGGGAGFSSFKTAGFKVQTEEKKDESTKKEPKNDKEDIGFGGFSTGGMEKIPLNESSLAKAQKLFDFGHSQPIENPEVKTPKSEGFGFGGFSAGGMKKIQLNESSLAKAQKLFDFEDSQPTDSLNDGNDKENQANFGSVLFGGFSVSKNTTNGDLDQNKSPEAKSKEESSDKSEKSPSFRPKNSGIIEEKGFLEKQKKPSAKKNRARGQFNFNNVNTKNQETDEEEYYDVFGGIQLKKVSENRQENTNMQIEEDRANKKMAGTREPLRPRPEPESIRKKTENVGTKKIRQNGKSKIEEKKEKTKIIEEPQKPKRKTIELPLKEIYELFPKIEKMNELRSKNKKKEEESPREPLWLARYEMNKGWKDKMLSFPWKKTKDEIRLACWCEVNLPVSYSQYFTSNESQKKDASVEKQKDGPMSDHEEEKKEDGNSIQKQEDEFEQKRKKVLFEQCKCNDQFLIGVDDLFDFFLYLGFDEKNATDEWFFHHLKKLCFKFQCSSLIYCNPPQSKILNAKNVLGELVYRYYTEFEAGQRSVIRQILEGDENPTRKMVLQICDMIVEPEKTTIELSDGWYSLWAEIQRPKTKEGVVLQSKCIQPNFNDGNMSQLCSLLDKRRVFTGKKIRLAGCGYWHKSKAPAADNAVEGNPIRSKKYLDLSFNSICPAKQWDKLGAQPGNSMIKSLQSIRPYGGMVCGLAFYILKKSLFMERFLWEDPKEGVREIIRPFEMPDEEDPNRLLPQEKSHYTFFGATVSDPKSQDSGTYEIYFMNYSRDDVYDAIGEGDFMILTSLRNSFFVKSLNYPRNTNCYSFDKGSQYANHLRLYADVRLSQIKFHKKASLLKNNWNVAKVTMVKEKMFIQNFVQSDHFRRFVEWKHFIYLNQISGYFRLDSDDGKTLAGSGINCTIFIVKVHRPFIPASYLNSSFPFVCFYFDCLKEL